MRARESFFGQLGTLAGSQQRENQLSRAFAACFNESRAFRVAMLALFWPALGHAKAPRSPERWRCSAEIATPIDGGGRVDLHLTYADASGAVVQDFYVESKVESPLTERQVEKYRKHGVTSLLVITKYRAPTHVKISGVPRLRWQDVHRALHNRPGTAAVDRELCRWMLEYLEELDMAYREDLTVADLSSCGKLFRSVRSSKTWTQVAARNIFEIAHACTGMLDDLHQEFLDAHPKLEAAPYHNSKTHYGKWVEPSDDSESHHLRWTIVKHHWSKWQLGFSICWSEDPQDDGRFFVMLDGSTVKYRDSSVALERFVTNGAIDRTKLLRHLESCARRWHVL